ncbi:MAG: SDR family oxidoreductase [bacterium]
MHVFIAGAGGPLGKKLITAFLDRDLQVTAMGYSKQEFAGLYHPRLTTLACDVTKPEQLNGVCKGADLLVSCLGITRMRNRMTHMDVDYQGNLNLLKECEKQGVRKFTFITPVGAEHGETHGVPLLQAKHLFKKELKRSGLDWVIFRAGGFYPDLAEMGRMAKKGAMIVVGSGSQIFTPVDVQDVAQVMVEDSLAKRNIVVEIGGPEDMSWNEICLTCFTHYGMKPRIVHVPVWLCQASLPLIKLFSPINYAMGKLVLFMSTHDLPTEKRGKLRFADYLTAHNTP